MNYELAIMGFSALIIIGILLHHPSKTLGMPSLLIFMAVGLSFGNGEWNFVYDDLATTATIGAMALNMIVFVGGLNSPTASIKCAWKEGGALSSFGVILTTLFFAILLNWLLEFDFLTCLLFAAIVASTDAAAVFSILESKKLKLKENTDTVLEFESATNDPVALLMVVILTDIIISKSATPAISTIAIDLVSQIFLGCLIGYAIGKLGVKALNYISLAEYGLIPVFILASFALVTFGAEFIGGNVLIAAYLCGVIFGNELKRGKEVNKHFFNALSWLAQSLMFIILGLQIFPQQLVQVFVISIVPALLLILIARPLAVQLVYLVFPKASAKKRLFISVIGLKGATPIVFALIPAAAGVPESLDMLHMVFFVVLFSIVIQGSLVEPLAKKLGLNQSE